jgi:sec-independent protein translocase protein TatC
MVAAGMVSVVALKQARAYVIVAAFVIGAIITPPDIISQFMLAIPMWMLYEIGIVVASVMQQKKPQYEQPS